MTDADADDTHTVTASSGDASVATVSVSGKRVTVRGVGGGTATVTVRATDDSGAPDATSAAVTFTATVPNSRPVVEAVTDVEVANGSTATRDVTVTDADASDTHTVTASSGDTSVATVTVTGKRVTVRGIGRGTATVTVRARDNSGAPNATSAARTFTVTVPNSRPAVGVIADVGVANGSTATRHVTVTDADASDTHTVTAASGDTSVATVSVTGKRVTVRGIGRGTATVTVRARDNSGAPNATSAARTFTVTVPNSRPAVGAIADVGVANGSTATRHVTVTDADASDTHTVTAASGDTSVATVSVTGKRVTVRGIGRGTATVTVHATDDSGAPNATSAARTFTVTVPNSRPAVGAIADVGVANGSTATRDVTVTDADASDTHTVTASSGDTSVATVSVSGKRVTVRGVGRGRATVTVHARDDSGAPNATSAARTFTVTVSNTRPAVASIANRTVSNGSTSAVDVTVTDADAGDAHTVTAASGDTSVATVTVSGKRVTVRGRGCGTATVTVHATDDSGAWNATSAARTFTATVPNDRPVVGPITGIEVANGSTATRDVTVTDDACGGVALTLMAVSSDPSVATVTVTGNRITVRGVGRGTATITVKATDESGASNATSAPATFTATVPNSRPAVAAIADIDVSNGSTSAPVVTVTDADAGDTHTVTATSDDTSVATVSVTGNRVTVRGVGRGTTTVTVWATDDSGESNATSTPATFTATVPNSRPVLDAIADRMVSNAATSTFVVLGDMHAPTATSTIGVLVTDADAGDRHALTATSTDLAVAGVGDREGRPTLIGVGRGTTTVTVWATDDSGESNATSTPATFTATVPNSPPAVAAIADWTVPTGATSTVHVLVTDADARDVHTLTATSTDTVVATVSATGTRLILTGLERGSTTIAVTATDDSGGPNATSSAVVFGVTVGNARPVVAPIADRTVANGVTDTVDVDVTDADADDAHTLSAGSDDNPTALAYATGGVVKVDALHRGTATVSVTATDDSGASNAASAPETFQVTVPNSRPAVGAMADRTVSNGAVHTVTVPVSDADAGDAHTLSASSDDTSVASVTTSARYAYLRGVGRGTATITVAATDDSGAGNAESAPETFRATVPNSRPSVDPVTVTVAVGETVTLEPGITDPDAGDTHTVAASSADASIATMAVSGTRLTITGVAPGGTTVTVAAMDDSGASNATSEPATFAVTVTPRSNSRPVVGALGDIELAAGTTRTATVGVTDTDADATHTVSASSSDLAVATVSVSGKELTLTGVSAGTATIGVAATDDRLAANSRSETVTFAATVTATSNGEPVVDAIGHVIVTEGATVAVGVTLADPDGDPLTLTSVSGDPAVVAVSAPSTNLALPAAATSTHILLVGVAEGVAEVTLVATDDGNATSTPVVFPVTVLAPPPPDVGRAFWVEPEVSGGDYTVRWDLRIEDGKYWKLVELRVLVDPGVTHPPMFAQWRLERTVKGRSFQGRSTGKYPYLLFECDSATHVCSGTDTGVVVAEVVAEDELRIRETGTVPGNLPYRTGVTKGGDAYVNIPVAVAPGVNGVQPRLSIDYGGGREREVVEQELAGDILGYGWHLSGLSTIRRCVKHSARDGVGLDRSDGLCLDGEPLQLVRGEHLEAGAEYRTLRESFAKITLKADPGGSWFEMLLPFGVRREYGSTPDSRLRAFVGAPVTFMWSVNDEADVLGNRMSYEYHEDEVSLVRHPKRIVYGQADASGEGDAEVRFVYEGRHDVATVPVSGHHRRQWLRLHRVESWQGGSKVREYRLESGLSDHGWSRLNRLQLCGYRAGAAQCLNAVRVGWMEPEDDLAAYKTCVDGLTDPLGAHTAFTYGTVTKARPHDFVLESPHEAFGDFVEPADAERLPPAETPERGSTDTDGLAVKPVVVTVSRDDGVGGTRDTHYAYLGRGWKSTRNWGFLGFAGVRETDDASDIVTHTQYRLDFPHYGRPAAVARAHESNGSSETLSERYTVYEAKNVAHASSTATTLLPYASETTEFLYEGGTGHGVVQETHASDLDPEGRLVDGLVRTVRTAHRADERTAAADAVWGQVAGYDLSDVKRRTTTTLGFLNRTADGLWVLGFAERETEAHIDDEGTTARILTTTRSPYGHTPAIGTSVRFPGDAALGITTDMAYDARGNRTTVTVSGGGIPQSRTWATTSHQADRYPAAFRNPEGHSETAAYDTGLGVPTSVTDANGRRTLIAYDAFGRETSRTRVWDDTSTTTSYEWCGAECAMAASACGALRSVAPAMKSTTTAPDAPETVRYFDRLGRLVRTDAASFGGGAARRVDVFHDARGRVACESAPYHAGQAARYALYQYDVRDRPTGVTRPDGGRTTMRYGTAAMNRTTATVTETVARPGGGSDTRRTRHTYNVLGELVETLEGAEQTLTAKQATTSFEYDGSGLLETVTAAGVETSFAYDKAGNRTSVTNPAVGTTVSGASATFVHSALGELLSRTDARGATAYEHDRLGRPTRRTHPDGVVAQWSWDPANGKGLLGVRSYGAGFSETYAYNSDARLRTSTTRIVAGGRTERFDTSYGYDGRGRMSSATHPSDATVSFAYNRRGCLESVSSGGTVLVAYRGADARGNATEVAYGNGVGTVRGFDAASGRLESLRTTRGTGATAPVLQANAYAWRSDGSLASRAGAATETFAYDHLNRLTEARTALDADRVLSCDYSLRGDLESKTDSASGDRNLTAYAYGTDTRLESVTVGGAAWTLHHDTSGHVTRYERPGRDDRFVKWDGRGLTTEVRLAASATSATSTALDAFAYGPDGARYHRRSQWAGDGATRTEDTYYAGAYEKTHRPDGSVVERTRLGAAVHVRTTDAAGNRGEGAWEYLHRDHLGSVESVTDESGNELAAMAHDPYGDRRRPDWTGRLTASSTTALVDAQGRRASRGFTGHEHLDRTGLVHMNGRVYDPLLGRFLSPDPVVSGPGGSQGWNLYAYVGNNPLSRTDPTGLFVAGPCSAPGSNCVNFAGGGGGWGGGTRTETVTSATQVFGVWLHRFRVWRSDWRQRWDSRRERWVFENHGAWEWLTQLIPYSTTVHASWRFVVAEEDPASEPVEPMDYSGIVARGAEEVWDFVIGDAIDTVIDTGVAARDGDWGGVVVGVGSLGCDIGKICKGAGKIARKIPGVDRALGRAEDWVRGVFKSKGPRTGGDRFRRTPNDLNEKLALDEAKGGAGRKIMDGLNDPNFKGMDKWQHVHYSADGKTVIHYVRDPTTGQLMDFKFK